MSLIEFRLKGSDGPWHIAGDRFRNYALYDYRPYQAMPPPPMDLSGSRGEAAMRSKAQVEAMRARQQAALDADVAQIKVEYEPKVDNTIRNAWRWYWIITAGAVLYLAMLAYTAGMI